MIPFDYIPEALRYPGVQIEIDGSQAGLGDDIPTMLVVGQKLAGGNAAAGEIVRISSVEDAKTKFGAGSMLHQMIDRYRKGDKVFDLFALPYSDNGAGVSATATLTAASVATAAGTYVLYIAGKPVSVGITASMTTAQIATAIAAAITAAGTDIPCTASAALAVVTLTARHKGSCGNNIDVRPYLYGEIAPAGLGVTIAGFAGGSGDPAVGNLETIIGSNRWYRYVCLGLNDAATLAAWHAESQRRYQPPVQAGFRAFTAFRGDFNTAAAYGESKNYEHISNLGLFINPDSTWEAAASYAAAAAPKLYNNPVTSLEATKLVGMIGVSYFDWTNANSLLFKGISMMEIAKDGSCYIKRAISMYRVRPDGSADDAWLDINAAERQERYRYIQRIELAKAFVGTAAAKNDEGYRPGLRITTEDSVKVKLLSLYKNRFQFDLGWVQAYDYYKTTLVVEQHSTNPSRFDFIDTPVFLSPFYNIAGINQFLAAVPLA